MPVKVLSQFWKADRYLSLLLGLLLLVVFVLYPMSDRGPLISVMLQALFSLILISGVPVVASNRTVMALATLLAVGTGVVGWLRLYAPREGLIVPGLVMWILFFSLLAGMLLARVFREGTINFHHIQGAVAVYLLLGVIWAGGYRLVVHLAPAAFNPAPAGDETTLMSRLVYFSFVTLTTVGYGDVTAVHPAARSLALLEALTGQLFPAVLIARLVSMQVSHHEGGRSERPKRRRRPATARGDTAYVKASYGAAPEEGETANLAADRGIL